MDPHANIREQRQLAGEVQAIEDAASDRELTIAERARLIDCAVRLSELVQALDAWRLSGGFDPYAEAHASR